MSHFEAIYLNYQKKLKFSNQVEKSFEVGIEQLIPYYDHFLFDGFGTLYLENTVYDDSIELIRHLKQIGKEIRLVTNAASRTRLELSDKLLQMGLPFHPNEIISSGSLLANLNRPRKFTEVYHFGRESALDVLTEAKIQHSETPVDSIVVLSGIPSEGILEQKFLEMVHILKKPGSQLIVLNPDVVAPTETGMVKVAGYLANQLQEETKCNIIYLGKPFPLIFEKAIYSLFPKKGSALMLGDTIWTDIMGAQNFGIDCALVNRGISKLLDSHKNQNIQPNYYLKNLKFDK